MNIKTYRNSRNETASTDGPRWWKGDDPDETSIALNLLQPVSALFPCDDAQLRLVQKARAVFISALRQSAPSVTPADDAERAVFRKAWDDAAAFAAAHPNAASGVPVFDCKLMVVGTADVVCDDGSTFCYAPNGWEWAGETNAVVRLLYAGFPIPCADDPHGAYTLRHLSRAVMALLIREQSPWFVEHVKSLPF